ncbi:histidine phosphatase family protein [Alkaliphilus peptidifermentans]|uniref:phosphoglycerate mutase (2,3-diphosphoglycerate-dependent) n=1 Tax=Alkaliphilus peptidifermentans DSM 18978 TaxID=1120976 RepID=A0A1G5K236_9FIRM|nr:histidine phosphatase family protein [Alkaliphilus peptidifermentans]SCY94705.1 alpha-ribazole phosphatase [Alkaliphilus peptidifermentans DSM 18978]
MTKLYLIRHGETDDNINKRLCGWSDPHLNARGRSEAEKLAKSLKNQHFDVVYHSGLKRTIETAEAIVNGRNYTAKALESLRELHFGQFEGISMEEVKEKHPQKFYELQSDYIEFCFPEGESLKEMHSRVVTGVEELLRVHEGQEILIVAHSGVIRSIIAHLITGDIKKHWSFKIDHCSVSIIESTPDFNILVKLNEIKY